MGRRRETGRSVGGAQRSAAGASRRPPTPNPQPPAPGSRSLLVSFRDAFHGVFHTLKTQRNLRIDLLAALLVVAAGVWLAVTPTEWAILTLCISLVAVTEMLNTALEDLADAAVPGYHPLIGAAKDVAAGAVLLSATGAVVVGILILGPRLTRLAGW